MNAQLQQFVRHVLFGDYDSVKRFLVSNDVDIDLPIGKVLCYLVFQCYHNNEIILRKGGLLWHGQLWKVTNQSFGCCCNMEQILKLLIWYVSHLQLLCFFMIFCFQYRRSPLKLAVIKNSVPIIELLLHYGANIEVMDVTLRFISPLLLKFAYDIATTSW